MLFGDPVFRKHVTQRENAEEAPGDWQAENYERTFFLLTFLFSFKS